MRLHSKVKTSEMLLPRPGRNSAHRHSHHCYSAELDHTPPQRPQRKLPPESSRSLLRRAPPQMVRLRYRSPVGAISSWDEILDCKYFCSR